MTSGIPQGSVLGPTLFIIYINDLPETVESMVHIFADDTKIYRKIATENDCVKLQKDLDILQEWSSKWLLSFNAKKCKVMRLGGQHPDFIYKMINNTDVTDLAHGIHRDGKRPSHPCRQQTTTQGPCRDCRCESK